MVEIAVADVWWHRSQCAATLPLTYGYVDRTTNLGLVKGIPNMKLHNAIFFFVLPESLRRMAYGRYSSSKRLALGGGNRGGKKTVAQPLGSTAGGTVAP